LQPENSKKALMTRVIIEEDMGGKTYSVQYTTDSKETLEKYYAENAEELRAQSNPFEGKYVAFRTELEVIGEAHNELFNK
jgi:predicted GNAT family N-acyltransferase